MFSTQDESGMHTIKEVDMLSAKMDLMLKHLNDRAQFKEQRNKYVQAMNMSSACEVCGDDGHLGDDCLKTREDVAYMNNNNGYCPQEG